MDAIQQRKKILDNAIDYAPPQISEVYDRLRDIIDDDGIIIHSDLDLLTGYDALRSDINFASQYLKIYPQAYRDLTPELKKNINIILALARAPIFCYKRTKSNNELRAICPLDEIVNEHMRTSKFLKRSYINGEKSKKGLSFVEEVKKEIEGETYTSYNIDLQMAVILEAVRSEIDSYEYLKMMKKKYNIEYYGLDLQDRLRRGEKVGFSEYDNLLSMQYATKELTEDEEFRKEVEIIVHPKNRNSILNFEER